MLQRLIKKWQKESRMVVLRFKQFIEWFLMLFLKKQASIVKQEAFFERQKAVLEYEKRKQARDKYLSKYSGRKKYVKSPKIETDN